MKKPSLKLLIFILLLLEGCGRDLEQAQKYSDMESNCDSLISQADIILISQKTLTDSLRKVSNDYIKIKAKNKLPALDRKITNTLELTSKIENVKKHLLAIKRFANKGEIATKRLIYYKRKYITYATVIQIHDENIEIQDITEGLSAKQFFSKYLPKNK